MAENMTKEEIRDARLAYEADRRAHKHDQPHWEEISHADRLHWVFFIRAKPQAAPVQALAVQ